MKRTLRFELVALLSTVLIPALAVLAATVNGVVIDSSGSPVSYASVQAAAVPKHKEHGTVGDQPNPWIEADTNGRFKIDLAPGKYRIRAKAESEGFPNPIFLLNADPTAEFPEIAVNQQDISNVRVVFGARGGVIEGEILDDASRTRIPQAKITIHDARNPEAYVDVFSNSDGRFQFAVPAKPVRISAVAAGYKSATFEGGSELTLTGGEHRTVNIGLSR